MRVTREGSIIKPGIETVEVDGMGGFNFAYGEADFADETAAALIKLGICKPMNNFEQVPIGAVTPGGIFKAGGPTDDAAQAEIRKAVDTATAATKP